MLGPLDEHYGYLADREKLRRFQGAIEATVQPGHVVLDLGCGSGLLGLMALRAGAAKVLFVEEGAIIEVARRTVTLAGFEDRAVFLHGTSYELDLPERVDVVLCDHVGYFGFDYGILSLLDDARQRFLKPNGVMVPSMVDLQLAPIDDERGRELVGRWRDGSVPQDFAWVAAPAAHARHAIELDKESLLAAPATLATLTLGAEADPYLEWGLDFDCTRDGMLDGLLGWFDCCLHGDIRMTNSPTAEQRLDRPQVFLPLEEPVTVRRGERIRASIMARPADHILAWTVSLPDQDKRFALTTFNGLLLDDESLERSRPDRVARLNDRGRAQQIILSYCDGKRTVAEVEARVREEHPQLFPSARATRILVRKILARSTVA